MKLTLHVGLPKTATTTIQHVLDSAKPDLAARGVLYPGTTRAQVELVRRVSDPALAAATGPGSLAEALGWVAEEVRANPPSQVILSCERMILLSPAAVVRLQGAIKAWLPEVAAVDVLAYVRDPIAWATSLCQQRLKVGTTRLEAFYANPWPFKLKRLIGHYVGAYGRDAVNLRHLHPDHLVNGKVVDDFMAAIGLPGFASDLPIPVLNSTLSQNGALVADALAGLEPREHRQGPKKRMYRRRLEGIAGPRFVLPREVQERIIQSSKGDMAYIRSLWGLDIRAVPLDPVEEPGSDPGRDPEWALAMARQIMAEVAARLADLDDPADENEA